MYCTCKTNYLQKHRNVFLCSTPVSILINYSLLHSYVGFSFLRKFFLPKIEHLTFWHVGFLPAHLFILLSADSCCVGMAFSSWPSIFFIVLLVKSTECQACWLIEGGKRINVKLYLKWSSSYSSLGWILFKTDAVKGAIKCLLSEEWVRFNYCSSFKAVTDTFGQVQGIQTSHTWPGGWFLKDTCQNLFVILPSPQLKNITLNYYYLLNNVCM